MMLATQYAKALRAVLAKEPHKAKMFFNNARAALARRGHEKLLPHIVTELQKLELAESRSAAARTITPERERTRVLFELYKQLTQSSSRGAIK